MSLGLAGKLGAQGSLFLGQQCLREDAREPRAEHFSGLTQGDPPAGQSLQLEIPSPSASPNLGSSESFCLFSCSVHGTFLFVWFWFLWVVQCVGS